MPEGFVWGLVRLLRFARNDDKWVYNDGKNTHHNNTSTRNNNINILAVIISQSVKKNKLLQKEIELPKRYTAIVRRDFFMCKNRYSVAI